MPPSLTYIITPNANGKKKLEEQRKRENLTELKKLEAKTGNYEIGIERLHRKEECIFRQGAKEGRKTKGMIQEARQKEMLENNMRVFGNVAIGIHGKELPKFRNKSDEWWKVRKGFKEKPQEVSLLKYKQNMKYWKKVEDLVLNDAIHEQASPDAFKTIYVKKERKNKVAENPNKLNQIKYNSNQTLNNTIEKQKIDYKWTTIENQFVERSNKLTADVDRTRAERGDYEPLYSSFNPNKTFVPPPSAYDALIQQKKEAKKSSISGSTLSKSKGGRAATAFQ